MSAYHAVSGTDFTLANGSVTIAAGSTNVNLPSLVVVDDNIRQGALGNGHQLLAVVVHRRLRVRQPDHATPIVTLYLWSVDLNGHLRSFVSDAYCWLFIPACVLSVVCAIKLILRHTFKSLTERFTRVKHALFSRRVKHALFSQGNVSHG